MGEDCSAGLQAESSPLCSEYLLLLSQLYSMEACRMATNAQISPRTVSDTGILTNGYPLKMTSK